MKYWKDGNEVDDVLSDFEKDLNDSSKLSESSEAKHRRAGYLLSMAFEIETFVELEPAVMNREQKARALGMVARANVLAGMLDPSRVLL